MDFSHRSGFGPELTSINHLETKRKKENRTEIKIEFEKRDIQALKYNITCSLFH